MPTRTRWTVAAVAVVAVVITAGWVVARRAADPDSDAGVYRSADGSITSVPAQQRTPAPDLAGTTLDGEAWRLADHLGHVVVLNVWASWCAPCRAEAPVLRAAAEEFADDGVRFTGLNIRDNVTAAKAFEATFGIRYPSVNDREGTLLLRFAGTLNPSAIPSTVVIDQQGRIAGVVLGRVEPATLRGLIEPLLAEAPPTPGSSSGPIDRRPASTATAAAG